MNPSPHPHRPLAAALLAASLAACGGGDSPASDPCAPNPCFAGVACTASGASFTCGACPTGYQGDGVACSDANGCAANPCAAGVTCTDVAAPGTGFTCSACPAGQTGDGVTCAELDGCAGGPCAAGVTCTDVPSPGSGFTCGACPPGKTGDGVTCAELDGCAASPCAAGVTCTDVPSPGSGFTCGPCPVGQAGDGVSCHVTTCADGPCLATTTCTDVPSGSAGYTCTACTAATCPVLRALAGPDLQVVAGAEARLRGAADGNNGGYTCAWTSPGAAALAGCEVTVTPAATTTYTLTVTDASARTATDTAVVAVAALLADAGEGVNVPVGGAATLTASWSGASCADGACVTCAWKDAAGLSVSDACSATVSPAVTTAYTLTVTDGGNGKTASDSTTVYVLGQAAQLCDWDVVVLTSSVYPSLANPNYVCEAGGTQRRQTVNGYPAVVLSDLVVSNARIIGYISVETTIDDDLIGFAWGWENPKHAYLLTWKQLTQAAQLNCGNHPTGIAVRKIDGAAAGPTTTTYSASFGFLATDYVYACADHWSGDRANDANLRDDTVFLRVPGDPGGFRTGWADSTTYRFEFFYTPARTKVFVYRDEAKNGSTAELLTTLELADASYPEGKFAFFSSSQEQVVFSGYQLASLDGFSALAGPDATVGTGGTAQLAGAAELAVPPYACAWKDGAGAAVGATCALAVTPAATTTYTLVVTDAFGRTATDAVTVTVGP